MLIFTSPSFHWVHVESKRLLASYHSHRFLYFIWPLLKANTNANKNIKTKEKRGWRETCSTSELDIEISLFLGKVKKDSTLFKKDVSINPIK